MAKDNPLTRPFGGIGRVSNPPPWGESVTITTTTNMANLPVQSVTLPLTVEQHLDAARTEVTRRLAACDVNTPMHDLWTRAYEALNHAAVEIARARKVT